MTSFSIITDSGVIPSGQNSGYSHTRMVRIGGAPIQDRTNGLRLRTKIHHDGSYDFQSSYTVEVWNSDRGWLEVCRWVGGDANIKMFNFPKVWDTTRDLPKAETAVSHAVQWMLDIAVDVLT